jgi:hypothetical protein
VAKRQKSELYLLAKTWPRQQHAHQLDAFCGCGRMRACRTLQLPTTSRKNFTISNMHCAGDYLYVVSQGKCTWVVAQRRKPLPIPQATKSVCMLALWQQCNNDSDSGGSGDRKSAAWYTRGPVVDSELDDRRSARARFFLV